MVTQNVKVKTTVVFLILAYVLYFLYQMLLVLPYPLLGIHLTKEDSNWTVAHIQADGIAGELGVNKGDIITSIDGASPEDTRLVTKWYIVEQARQFTVMSANGEKEILVPSGENQSFYDKLWLTIFSLPFILIGIITYYRKPKLYFVKKFLLTNVVVAFSLLSAITSCQGYIVPRTIFYQTLIWIPYFLVVLTSYFPIYINNDRRVKLTKNSFLVVAVAFSFLQIGYQLFTIPEPWFLLLDKGVIFPLVLSLLVCSIFFGYIALQYAKKTDRYQVWILSFGLLCSLSPLFIFFMLPTIWHKSEVNTVFTSFFLMAMPLFYGYVLVRKGMLWRKFYLPDLLLRLAFAVGVVGCFLLFHVFHERTGQTSLLIIMAFLYIVGLHYIIQNMVQWSNRVLLQRKERIQEKEEMLSRLQQTDYYTNMLKQFVIKIADEFDERIKGVFWIRHDHSILIEVKTTPDPRLLGLSLNRKGKLEFSSKANEQQFTVFPMVDQQTLVGYVIIEKGKVSSLLEADYLALLTSYMQMLHRLVSLQQASNAHTTTSPVELNEDHLLLESLEEEKEKIAEHLHDNIIQNLVFVLRDAKEIKTNETKKVHGMVEKLEDTLFELRDLCSDLYPSVVEDIGLKRAIDTLIRETKARHHIKVECNYDSYVDNSIPITITVSLFQMIKELLQNVLKHAEATTISITIETFNHTVQVRISDDGVGFDTLSLQEQIAKAKHYGLLSIKRKVNELQGSFDIFSQQGKGTKVMIRIPTKPQGGVFHEKAN